MNKTVVIILIIGAFFSMATYDLCALEREQEEIYDFVRPTDILETEQQTAKHSHPFYTYFWRIATAPLVVMFTFPFDEETDIYETYLSYVNKGTGRQWRKKEFSIDDKIFTQTESEGDSEEFSEEITEQNLRGMFVAVRFVYDSIMPNVDDDTYSYITTTVEDH